MVEVCSDGRYCRCGDVEMWYVVGDEIDRVRTGAWLSSGGKSKGSIERCGRRDFRMKGGLEG